MSNKKNRIDTTDNSQGHPSTNQRNSNVRYSRTSIESAKIEVEVVFNLVKISIAKQHKNCNQVPSYEKFEERSKENEKMLVDIEKKQDDIDRLFFQMIKGAKNFTPRQQQAVETSDSESSD
jgi:hypothetical protein